MNENIDAQLQQALKSAVADARLLALVFIPLGGLGLLLALSGVSHWQGQVMAAVSGTILLTPGILYWIAGHQLARRQPAGARLGRWAAGSQIVATLLPAIVFVLFLSRNPQGGLFLVPSIVSAFFSPALVAFLFSMTKAMRITRNLEQSGHGFQVLPPQAVLPVVENDPPETGDPLASTPHAP